MTGSQEAFAVAWSVAALVVFVSVATSLAQMIIGPAFLPPQVRELNERHGWPGRESLTAQGGRRTRLVLVGCALIGVILYVPIYARVDPSLDRNALQEAVFLLQLSLCAGWLAVLIVLWWSHYWS